MRNVTAWIAGVYALLRLGLLSRLAFRGPYWSWRWHTAFGRGAPESRVELLAAVLRYGRWMGQMRRLR